MAKNVTLMGASYSDVPAVNLPQTGGGTARFTDTSGTTATAADVAQGKVFYAADGTETTGTASGGSATIESLSVTANGTYTAPSGVDGYSPVVVNVPTGGGGGGSASDPVKFIDYDGTILHSYSVSDFMALIALPANPSHSGLTAQGWNWSLADAKSQLTAYPEAGLTIGQMYITNDGKTRIYVHFEEERKSPYLGICPNGTVTVDWGDNSATDTLTGTSLTSVKTVQHVFPSAGDYVITLTVENGSFAFYGNGNTSYILRVSTATTANISKVYTNAVRKVELGTGANIGSFAFNYCQNLKAITITSTVTSIQSTTFQYCYSLTSITIPHGVISIPSYAFNYCHSLTSISIPNSIERIESYAFQYCYSLIQISISDNVTSIGTYAFIGCYRLASIIIPSGVKNIAVNTFRTCYSLKSITISDATSIGATAFYGCFSLASLTIPDGVTSIGNGAFSDCRCLTSLSIPDGVTSIESETFSGCHSLISITIPDGVTSVESNAFNGCHSLISITIPDSVTSINGSAFRYCYSLTSLSIPDGVTSITANEFFACHSLASLTIPDGVTSVGSNAFNGCQGMKEYHFLPTTPPTLANTNAFTGIPSDCIIYVPQGCLTAYQTATNWSTYASYMQEEPT